MLVGERMSQPVITTAPHIPIAEALNIMRQQNIRRMPVLESGKLVGIITNHDLLNASPSPATSLSIWEINYLLSKITVKDVMTAKVLTVQEDTPIEEAARVLADNKIGGLPVMRGQELVGMITETDLFKIFLELMGAREPGVRITALVAEQRGQLASLTQAVSEIGGNFVAFGQFSGDDPSNREVTFKVSGVGQEQVHQAILPLVEKVKDIRTSGG